VENVCLSYYYPANKLFEYLLAGVPAIEGRAGGARVIRN
jgi:hypothetical protein